MINFFRKIRKQSMDLNKTANYLKYAIGEIVLVVIGILLALQINDWNENRMNREKEADILKQLLNEYSNNLNQLISKIDIRNDVTYSVPSLLEYRKIAKDEINIDSVNLHISRLLTRATFDPELGVTNELINSEKLYLITNSELRTKLTAFTSNLSELIEEELATLNLVEDRFTPYLIEHYQIGPSMMASLIDDKFISKHKTYKTVKNFSSRDLFKKDNPYDLLQNDDMIDYLALLLSNTDYTNDNQLVLKLKLNTSLA